MSTKSDSSVHQTVIPCGCGCGVVMLWEFEKWGDEPHHVMADWSVGFQQGKLRSRIRTAWRIIRGKDPWMHTVILHDDGIKQLEDAITRDKL